MLSLWRTYCSSIVVELLSIDWLFTFSLNFLRQLGIFGQFSVIDAWTGWSQGKLWWRLVAILTCKSFVWFGYRGERLIEPSSSWFPPKFLVKLNFSIIIPSKTIFWKFLACAVTSGCWRSTRDPVQSKDCLGNECGKQHREQLDSSAGLVEPGHGQDERSVQLQTAPIGLQVLYTFPRNLQNMVQQAKFSVSWTNSSTFKSLAIAATNKAGNEIVTMSRATARTLGRFRCLQAATCSLSSLMSSATLQLQALLISAVITRMKIDATIVLFLVELAAGQEKRWAGWECRSHYVGWENEKAPISYCECVVELLLIAGQAGAAALDFLSLVCI